MAPLPGSVRHGLAIVSVAAALLLSRAAPVCGQSVKPSVVKAAFLYNFAKFTIWPSDALAPGQRLVLCVSGDDAVADALQQAIQNHEIEGHELTLKIVNDDGPIPACHLLYIAGHDAKRFSPVLEVLRSTPVFTVGEGERFVESGGVAQLVLQNDRMRFAINPLAAERGRLLLSSKLLSLSKHVLDELHVPR